METVMKMSRRPLFALAPLLVIVACNAASDSLPQTEGGFLSSSNNPLATPPMTSATDVFAGDFNGDGHFDAARWLSDGNPGVDCARLSLR